MKLATFVESGNERFGMVLGYPLLSEDWVFDPNLVQDRLKLYASRGTSPLNATPPHFFDTLLPASLAEFLGQGQAGLDRLRDMECFLKRFIEQSDHYILRGASFRVADIKLKAPIPRPTLFFGLVQNSPTAWRSRPERTHLNLFPQGHQRPQGSILDPGDPIVLPYSDKIIGGWNPELGVIIGQGGRNIPVEKAMSYVAGLTIVSDVTYDYYRQDMFDQSQPYDWFEDAMSSWGDKKSDARTPMGPYLVTMDEIGNPYDLLIYTRQSGLLRDRSHTGAMALGIERTIHWLSSFRQLNPGDVIHMGTMGYDGSPHLSEFVPTQNDYIESEVEKLGILRNPMVIDLPATDWRDKDDLAKTLHPTPVIRDLILHKQDSMSMDDWSLEKVRHAWIVFGNYADAEQQEGMKPRPYPRFLCAPKSILADAQTPILISHSAGDIWLGCELAYVVKKVATQIKPEDASDHILGYMPLLAIYDTSFEDRVIEPASMQERYLPKVYGRWHDSSNIIGALYAEPPEDALCRVSVDGVGNIQDNTSEYIHSASETLMYISRYITLFPGDVITLGRFAQRLQLPVSNKINGIAEIDGIGQIKFQINDMRQPK